MPADLAVRVQNQQETKVEVEVRPLEGFSSNEEDFFRQSQAEPGRAKQGVSMDNKS
jgi:hypothetical protein